MQAGKNPELQTLVYQLNFLSLAIQSVLSLSLIVQTDPKKKRKKNVYSLLH
jgi:hypothetical protein